MRPFVIRIHNDAGYIVLPHTHPMDENITVVQGSWWVGMSRRFSRSAQAPMELGAYGFVPKTMAHFDWAKTDSIYQVHGIGPFGSKLVDPAYELTDKGVFELASLLLPGRPTSSSPPDCFALKIGALFTRQSAYSVLGSKTERRAILGNDAGIKATVAAY